MPQLRISKGFVEATCDTRVYKAAVRNSFWPLPEGKVRGRVILKIMYFTKGGKRVAKVRARSK